MSWEFVWNALNHAVLDTTDDLCRGCLNSLFVKLGVDEL